MSGDRRSALGNIGENIALKYLLNLGYKLVIRNYKITDTSSGKKLGEIDLVMLDNNDFVFVEVRTKQNVETGTPLESINKSKRRQIERCARLYLDANDIVGRYARFDVVGITITAVNTEPLIEHIQDAFICGD